MCHDTDISDALVRRKDLTCSYASCVPASILEEKTWPANAFQHAKVVYVVRCVQVADTHRMLAVWNGQEKSDCVWQ